MGSKSKASSSTNSTTTTNVMDRRAVMQQGQQILDSIVVANDDKVVKAALSQMSIMVDSLSRGNTASVQQLANMVDRALNFINKGQADITRFGMEALEGARKDLRGMMDKGEYIIKLSNDTVGKAMTMAERVANDQAENQRQALEIIAETKTGDFTDTLQNLSISIMGFALLALYIVRKQ
ncbi:hypothetical protein [Paracoccus sp. TOH]|uniref:hypothetical protein n=1 Tax=Paracoccus sp. TOH TaxID=1263728 RepID=UPI0025B07A17|nr:hypothetical protein [Paracoccus sp. TOH]WJS83884.1 hypothetical protein NBE95_08925 [Paracoccus sp. TOH]